MASKVYFTSMRTHNESLPQKLQRLLKKAGMDQIDFDGKYAAVKIHFGELGNLAYLRPNWAKAVCDFIKQQGGKPFLTDCNTLYVGSRKNALDHLDTAYENGFNPFATGRGLMLFLGIALMVEGVMDLVALYLFGRIAPERANPVSQ